MTTKEKTFKERDNEKARGKKRYQERIIEEHEAEKEIKQYNPSKEEINENSTDERGTFGFHGLGPCSR